MRSTAGVAPDTFNYLFAHPDYLGFLADQTHIEVTKVIERLTPGVRKITCLRLRQP